MKKVLIVTYYWPPSGGSGVQRWLKFVKYLREFAWEPVVYTPSNGEFPEIDESLFKDIPKDIEIVKTPIWEPYTFYKKFIGQKKDTKINTAFLTENKKPRLAEKVSVWIRGNFFIPDARKFWIKPSVKFLNKYLKEHPVDAIVSTGPPHSMHLIALGVVKKLKLPWLADFRDPWTNIDFYHELMLTDWADKKHRRLEKEVLKTADAVTAISVSMTAELRQILNDPAAGQRFHTITNGYDSDDLAPGVAVLDKKFSISHIGTLVKSRNPVTLWQSLKELCAENPEFAEKLEIKLVGKMDISVSQSIDEHDLRKYLTKIDYLPHSEVTKIQQQVQVLLLLLNNTPNAKGILTGKFFEYLSARRPILTIGPTDGDAAKILAETKAGKIVDFDDKEKLKAIVLEYFELYKKGELFVNSADIEKYSRRELTRTLSEKLNAISKRN